MSHIPNSAMKHAGPIHHDAVHHDPAAPAKAPSKGRDGRIGRGTWLAIGGTLVAGAAAALAVPLLRARFAPVPKRRGKRTAVAKGKRRGHAAK